MLILCLLLFACVIVLLQLWIRERSALRRRLEEEKAQSQSALAVLGRQERRYEQFFLWMERLQKSSDHEIGNILIDAVSAITPSETLLLLTQDSRDLTWRYHAGRGLSPEKTAIHPILTFDGQPRLSDIETIIPGALSYPLRVDSRCIGFLAFAKPAPTPISDDVVRQVEKLCAISALVLSRKEMAEEIVQAQHRASLMLGATVEAKDSCTFTHLTRTQRLARAVAEAMHIPEPWIRHIERGAFLHDIGKIGIPEAILNKPGPLTEAEYAVIKNHPAIGRRILSSERHFEPAAWIVLYHHEWFNGQGYPERLAGGEIPLGARIVQVVDAWDAMTSNRPYRRAMSTAAAISELRRQSGTQFDPKIVDVFLHVQERLDAEGIATTEGAKPHAHV